MKRRLSSLFIVFMVVAPLAVAIDQQPAPAPAPAAVEVPCGSKSNNILSTACGRCGDGQCVKSCGETATTCPADCGGGGVPKKS